MGTTVRVVVGGQLLRGADEVYVSGTGVQGEVLQYVRPLGQNELSDVGQVMRDLVRRRWSLRTMRALAASDDPPMLPDHPWLRDLEHKTPAELARLRKKLFDDKKQLNPQISDQVEIELKIAPEAAPGDRELRLLAPGGLTNPVRFQVGTLPEVCEGEGGEEPERAAGLPVVLNGQIMPGEVDRFWVRARAGQQLVLRMQARRLIPYLADAVPGWFQGTMTLYDASGREVAYGDDYGTEPDPVLLYKVPAEGVYRLEVRDAIYRGRDDFVYRVAVGELPFVTRVFPLGGQAGSELKAAVWGWNLPVSSVKLESGAEGVQEAEWQWPKGLSNPVRYAVGTLPEWLETEPNDTVEGAQKVALPGIVNGRIGEVGEVDFFRIEAKAGEEVVAEVQARRLGSPLDSVLQLMDAEGKVLGANDDEEDKASGLVTHHADSYLRVKVPQDGVYFVCLSDAQHQGGDGYAYRLRLSAAQPDFVLRVVPSAVNLGPGRSATVTVHAIRKDGFEGDIELALAEGPAGYTMSKAKIPAGESKATVTIAAPRGAARGVFPLRLEGRAQIGGVQVTRQAAPAEEMMQAFAYQHFVVGQELLAAVGGARKVPAVWRPIIAGVQATSAGPVRVPLRGEAQVQVKGAPAVDGVKYRAANRPRGIGLRSVTAGAGGLVVTITADATLASDGDKGNLIVEVRAGRRDLGVLPAIAFEVVR
ncbi:MAG: PPC domain-containing protein [Armatimonadia bacterium]